MEKYGFIYVWYDKKHKRYYVGSHWGHEDDGYICSSSWMRKAYQRRPSDFRRRIIARITSSRQDLLLEENRWLKMIQDDELGSRFYNLTKHLNGHWSTDEKKRMSVGEKISVAMKETYKINGSALAGRTLTEEHKRKIGKGNKGKIKPQISEERKKEISDFFMGKILTEEHKRKISVGNKGKTRNRGRVLTDEHKRKISEARKLIPIGRKLTDEHKRKISEANKKYWKGKIKTLVDIYKEES